MSGPSPRNEARGARLGLAATAAAVLVTLASSAARPAKQETPPRRPWPAGEGALENDVFLPVSDRAGSALEAGDLALSAVSPNRTAAFDAWRRALAESAAGDCVPAPRGTESTELAVLRRLDAGGEAMNAAWRERFDAGAELARAAARTDLDALGRVERSWPRTRAAARAALTLADVAIESGANARAASWLERARAHAGAEVQANDAALATAIARRETAVRSFPGAKASFDDGTWKAANHLEFEARVALASSDGPREGIRSGIAFLPDGGVVVQGADSLHLVGVDRKVRSLPLRLLVRGNGWSWIGPFVEEEGAWSLLPAVDGELVALVAGRGARTRGNALLVLDTASAQGAPRISWGYSDSGFRGEVAGSRTIEETLGPGLWEFQPGPRFVGGRVIVQARQWEADESSSSGRGGPIPSIDESTVRAWCLAFDADSGLPSWKTLLAVGPSAEVRLWGARGIARPGDPIVQVAGRVFAGTGIGTGVWLDAGTGRAIRSIRNRRAPQGAPRWRRGAAAPNLPGGAEAPVAMLWAPSDSDRLYTLDAATASGSFHRAPVEIGNAQEIVGLTGESALVLEEGGGRANLLLVDLVTGARTRSVPYPRGERLAGGGLASARRAIVASERGVRLFDLERDLELLDAIVLDGSDVDPASGIAARGDRVFVASERALWILRAR